MEKLVVASARRGAGKTCVVVGLAKALKRKSGYMKPFGDRLLYKKKRLWDYDSALVVNLLGLDQSPEDITIGFEHSKLRYMFDAKTTKERLVEIATASSKGKDVLFVEGGRDLSYGMSVNLDASSVTRALSARMLVVVSGDPDAVVDDIAFVKRSSDLRGVNLAGVIVNKVQDPQDFRDTYLPRVEETGLEVLGVLPSLPELSRFTVSYLADRLFAKVVTAEQALNRTVENIFIGAMSASAALQNPLFKKAGKLIITSGDRSDMILAALETDTAGIIVTNNVLPSSTIISKAAERNVPLLVVPTDTYQTAKQIDDMEPLLTKDDAAKVELLVSAIRKNVNLKSIA
jgi:BioD-like phosphotransacetylase family protein